jgi:hypothetical protein
MDDLRELSRRLEILERQNRRIKRFGLLLILMACSIALIAQIKPFADAPLPTAPVPSDGKLRAEGFILTDEKGNERASLVTDGAGSVFLVLFDKGGKARANLQVSNDGPSLNFYDTNAKPRLVIGSTTMVGSHVANNGIVEKSPPSSIVMFDSLGQFLWRTP